MALDYHEFEQLLNNFKDFQKKHEQFIRQFLTEMGLRALAQTKALTPVDTGNLRNRWELSAVFRKGDSLYLVLFNPVIYASFVEDGHMQDRRFLPIEYLERSRKNANEVAFLRDYYGYDIGGVMLEEKWIPGQHMARISITKVEREIPKRFEKAFNEFVKGLGVA